ncbi:hypothetical protein MYAM1_000906 [Malassezia yamatoensis]|uniref:Exosome complex component CSL4 C-terminal domain-containing protein n=1 Tax=Malassezia yamatoensis TaxID=253288 RepID=A0AAJ5YV38_9BASI|nr:hypothetical protein MYAM1_000906 [Malassezia yamatoensis]
MNEKPLVIPGQPVPLPVRVKANAGAGTYEYGDYLVASRIGYAEENLGDPSRKRSGGEVVATVSSIRPPQVIPEPESTILGRVTRVNPRQATISILVVNGHPCGGALGHGAGARGNRAAGEGVDGTDFQGIVRAQDVRSTDKDSVILKECFRPGDIIRATVISLGDARSYYLSTVGNHLGVIHASSSDTNSPAVTSWIPEGRAMQPLSWKEMVDPVTGRTEPRKVAKPEWL